MSQEDAYQLALKVYEAAARGNPMPKVPEEHQAACERLWKSIRRRLYIK